MQGANINQSYHDLAVRMEPIILELEREENDLLIIAHESVLRVLYGYLMACNAADIPKLEFPRDEIIEVKSPLSRLQGKIVLTVVQIIPSSYNNVAKRIKIPDLPRSMVPGSPEDICMPVPPSGAVSPAQIGTPQLGSGTSTPQRNPSQPLNVMKTHINPSS
jgi:6-phosphofructo-2-kinase/fructose-2,6-biphosphatase 4